MKQIVFQKVFGNQLFPLTSEFYMTSKNFNALQNNGTKVEWGSMAQSKITQPPLLQQFPLLFPQLSNQSSYFNCFNMKR